MTKRASKIVVNRAIQYMGERFEAGEKIAQSKLKSWPSGAIKSWLASGVLSYEKSSEGTSSKSSEGAEFTP